MTQASDAFPFHVRVERSELQGWLGELERTFGPPGGKWVAADDGETICFRDEAPADIFRHVLTIGNKQNTPT